MPRLYHGHLVHPLSLTLLEYLSDPLLCVGDDGIIEWIEKAVPSSEIQGACLKHGLVLDDRIELVALGPEEFLCPGLIDTHTHAPQYPDNGTGSEFTLLEWLQHITFPRELKYADLEYAKDVYGKVVARTLNAGTTTSCYYSSIHLPATKALVDICLDRGQRAFVGKPCMDRNCPSEYSESSAEAQESSVALIEYCKSLHSCSTLPPLVSPILTPRFAISTTAETMTHLASLSAPIQTHLSENHTEIAETKELHPDCSSYTAVYDKYGLLTSRTILAHCVHLDEDERKLIKKRNAGVSHCPTSNFNLNSGVACVREMLDMGIKVGLGSDCSGGYALGILPSIRNALLASKVRAFASSHTLPLTLAEVFYMATLGGAEVCNLADRIGNFEVGKEFDALHIRASSPNMWVEKGDPLKTVWEKWVMGGDDRDIANVWVRGRRVGGAVS